MTPEERKEIIRQIKEIADRHEPVTVWSFVKDQEKYKDTHKSEIESIAHEIKMDNRYSHEPANDQHKIYLYHGYKEPTWSERHPIFYEILKGTGTAIATLIVGILLYQWSNRDKDQVDSRQDKHLNSLSDSIAKIQKRIDTLK